MTVKPRQWDTLMFPFINRLLQLWYRSTPVPLPKKRLGRLPWAAVVTGIICLLVYLMSRSQHSIDPHVKEDDFLYARAVIEPARSQIAPLKAGITMHIVVPLILVGSDPHATANAKDTLTWIVVYSTAAVHLHLITDAESSPILIKVMARVQRQANCPLTYTIDTIDAMYTPLLRHLHASAPKMKLDILQDHMIAKMLPMILHWQYPHLDRIAIINSNIKLRSDPVQLYEHFQLFDANQTMAMTLTQGSKFASAFAVHRHAQKSKLGLSPPEGWPGFNTDVMLIDLAAVRNSRTFQRYIDLESQFQLIAHYDFRVNDKLPDLDEWLTLVAARDPQLFYTLPCQWNIQQVIDINSFPHCLNDIKAMEFGSNSL